MVCSFADVDPVDHAMRVGGAHHCGIDLAGQRDVVGVAAFALDQGGVLRPQHRLADAEFGQGPVVVLVAGLGSLFTDIHAALEGQGRKTASRT